MRKFMFLLLLAGAATPAMARPFDRTDEARPEQSDRHQAQQQEQQQAQQKSSDDHHAQRAERSDSGNNDRPHFAGYARSNGGDQAPAAVQGYSGNAGGQAVEARRQHFGGYQGSGQETVAVQPAYSGDPQGEAQSWRSRERRPSRHDQADEQQGWTARDRGSNGSWRQLDRPPPNVMRSRVPVTSDVPRQGTQPPLSITQQYARNQGNWSGHSQGNWSGRNQGSWSGHNQTRWSGNWRNDHRYDWQDRRRRHSSWFHLGAYFDPFGWGYQPFSIGWRLWPNYYSSNYWFDAGQYGLPYAPPGYQWVRYYDDALLVDTWSGEVVDVIRDFFW